MVLKAFVTEANYTDRELAARLIPLLPERFPRLTKLWADGIYRGEDFIAEMLTEAGIDVEIIERDPTVKGFKLLPRRWVVERTFAWLGNYRRLVVRYDRSLNMYRAFFHLACALITLRFLNK